MNRRQISWVRNPSNNQYFNFLRLNLNSPYFLRKLGVYVIWYATPNVAKAIYVGQGVIGERLKEHRNNPRITQHSTVGQLRVTWALIDSESERLRIEAGLHREYNPLESQLRPDVEPIYTTKI